MVIKKTIRAEPITQLPRIGVLEYFGISGHDMEMLLQVRVQTLNLDGVPVKEAIALDKTITGQREQSLLARFQDVIYTQETRGSFVLPNGSPAQRDEEGNLPPNAISYLTYFQGIKLRHLKKMGLTVNDETSLLDLMYAMISGQIDSLDKRGQL